MADVHFRVPYGPMSPHRYFGVPESQGKWAQRGRSPWNSVKRSGLITILGKLNAIVNCRVPIADVHFRVPYGPMSPHRYFGVPESKGKWAQKGGSPWNSVKRSRLITILGKLNAIVNCRVPMADVHFLVPYGPMSPHRYFGVPESQGKWAQRGRSLWNSVKRSGLITILGKLNAIVNCRVPMTDVHFRVPYGPMSPHRYFGVLES